MPVTLRSCPVAMFHDLMLESADPVKRTFPWMSVAMQVTEAVWPLKICNILLLLLLLICVRLAMWIQEHHFCQ